MVRGSCAVTDANGRTSQLRPSTIRCRTSPRTRSRPIVCAMGRTRVLCTVCEEPSVPRWMQGSGRGWVTAEYSMLPGSTDRRSQREAARGKQSGRTQEIQRLIGRSLRGVTDLPALGERHAVGRLRRAPGRRRHALASITGAYAALALACAATARARRPRQAQPAARLGGGGLGGHRAGRVVLDLPYEEDSTPRST